MADPITRAPVEEVAVVWAWDEAVRRFRNLTTGRFLAARRVHELRDRYVDHRVNLMDTFIADTVGGVDRTDRVAWRAAVRTVETRGWRRIENTLIAEYTYGRGGIAAMTEADTTRLRGLLREQKGYWRAYMREAEANPEKMTTRYMQNRSRYYHKAGVGFFERGRAGAWGGSMPAYPGDFECGPNCRCSLRWEEGDDEVRVYWQKAPGDSCDGCVEASKIYNPYVITRMKDEEAA